MSKVWLRPGDIVEYDGELCVFADWSFIGGEGVTLICPRRCTTTVRADRVIRTGWHLDLTNLAKVIEDAARSDGARERV